MHSTKAFIALNVTYILINICILTLRLVKNKLVTTNAQIPVPNSCKAHLIIYNICCNSWQVHKYWPFTNIYGLESGPFPVSLLKVQTLSGIQWRWSLVEHKCLGFCQSCSVSRLWPVSGPCISLSLSLSLAVMSRRDELHSLSHSVNGERLPAISSAVYTGRHPCRGQRPQEGQKISCSQYLELVAKTKRLSHIKENIRWVCTCSSHCVCVCVCVCVSVCVCVCVIVWMFERKLVDLWLRSWIASTQTSLVLSPNRILMITHLTLLCVSASCFTKQTHKHNHKDALSLHPHSLKTISNFHIYSPWGKNTKHTSPIIMNFDSDNKMTLGIISTWSDPY